MDGQAGAWHGSKSAKAAKSAKARHHASWDQDGNPDASHDAKHGTEHVRDDCSKAAKAVKAAKAHGSWRGDVPTVAPSHGGSIDPKPTHPSPAGPATTNTPSGGGSVDLEPIGGLSRDGHLGIDAASAEPHATSAKEGGTHSWQGSKSCKAVVRSAKASKSWHAAGTYHTASKESQPCWEHDAGHAAEPVIDWWAKSAKASGLWHATAPDPFTPACVRFSRVYQDILQGAHTCSNLVTFWF